MHVRNYGPTDLQYDIRMITKSIFELFPIRTLCASSEIDLQMDSD